MATTFKFRLYVAGNSPNSVQATANLHAFCREFLPERYQIEIVDVFREPKRALTDGVLIMPLLVKLLPGPDCKILGTLSHQATLIQALGLIP